MMMRRLLCWTTLTLFSAAALAVPPAVDPVNNEISIVLAEEPQWLNTIKATDQIGFIVIDHITEGLMTRDAQGNLAGGVAQRWKLTDDRATFWLRKKRPLERRGAGDSP